MSTPKKDERDVVWEDLIPGLISYAQYILKGKGWFRGNRTESYLEGKEALDYVMEAIEKYLLNPEKYDPQKGDLEAYMKYNLIRSIVSNDYNSTENKTTRDLSAFIEDPDSEYADSILPHLEAYFDEQIDYDNVIARVAELVKGDRIMEEILLGICSNLKRRETIDEFAMSDKEYDNGVRRLETLFRKIANEYEIEYIPYEQKRKI